MIGGSLMLDGIRSMMGHGGHGGGHAFGGLDQAGAGAHGGSPSQGGGGPGSAGGGDLARQAGIDDMGKTPASRDDAGESRRAGLFDGASDDQLQQQQIADDEEYEVANDYEDDDLGGNDDGGFDGGDEQ
jgi:hypothetical protein